MFNCRFSSTMIWFMVSQFVSPSERLPGVTRFRISDAARYELHTVWSCILGDGEGKSYAYYCRATLRTALQTPSIIQNIFDREYKSERKNGHNIAQRFKKEKRFTGQLKEDTNQYFENYERAANDFVLDHMQRFRYLHNILDGNARTYCCSSVQDKASGCNDYNEAKSVMEE